MHSDAGPNRLFASTRLGRHFQCEGFLMRILRIRPGFQADHSSSSYLFYAVDGEVSAAGQRVAHRFSSRAEVDERFARYQKWGESELSDNAYRELLGEHYDVMASES